MTSWLMLFSITTLSSGVGNNMADNKGYEEAIFAGGCFWCMQADFDYVDGVIKTTVGYIGGHVENPTYGQVSSGKTGHAESLQIIFDPTQISYEQLLQIFWHNIDPLASADQGQFCDIGNQYRADIFYYNEQQHQLALQSKKNLEASHRFQQAIQVEISPVTTFYPAEGYHQKYYYENPKRYKVYRYFCGRDKRLRQLWGP